jgi:hypothetical protein
MDKLTKATLARPLAHCVYCGTRTPHVHERLALQGQQVARAVCTLCKNERPRDAKRE